MIGECAVGWCATDTTGPARMRAGLVCAPCRRAWRDLVTGLIDAFDWLGASMVRYAHPRAGSGPVSGSPEPPLPLRPEMADQRAAIVVALREWARQAVTATTSECGRWRLAGPASEDPAVVARWLVARVDWLCGWDRFGLMAVAFSEVLSGSYGLAPWGRTRRDLPVPCTACGVQAVSLYGGDEWIKCRVCGHRIPWWRYERWVRKALAEDAAGRVDDGRVQAGGAA